ncbi:MAG: biosynthetic-type acetolactate synthase large subunit [Chloroflexota bacterium]|nr:biosynthetic-type acetolactate synthase large subunit [Chloroflexota bacterium]
MKLNGGQMICQALLNEGVDTIFGIPGGAIMPLYQTLPQYPGLRHILVRHEQGASMAADGYGRVTGKVGVCFATSGPGATNLVTGLAGAMMDSVPLVAITGQVTREAIGTDAFQEADVTGVTLPVIKHNFLVMSVEELPRVMKEAFYLARTGRPGPVLVDVPKDIFVEAAEFEYPETVELPGYPPQQNGDPEAIKQAAELIAQSKRPVIMAGHGIIISGAYKELQELAEKGQFPVVTTLLGIGSFKSNHVLNIGLPGMHGSAYASHTINESDLLIALGMRFDDRVTSKVSLFAPNAKVIHVDIDPAELGKNVRPTVPIVGDVKHVLKQLMPLVEKADRREWLSYIDELQRTHPLWREEGDTLRPQDVIQQISDSTEGKAIIATGVGQHQMWAAQLYKFTEYNSFITSGGLGSMGYETPSAMGAQVGMPDRVVWTIAGDGGFQMTLMELATMVENQIPVKIALINNNSLGMVRQWQDIFYDHDYVATLYTGNPDFVKLAEAYGMRGIKVTRKDEVGPAVEQAMKWSGPVLVDFHVDQMENIYPFIPPGTGVGQIVEDPRLIMKSVP